MKNIDPSFTTIKRTVCPFCNFGCEFGVVFDDFGIKGVEYIKEGNSEGRLCPRGSASPLYLDHPRRLSMPVKDGKVLRWQKVAKELKKIISKPESVAITFDRNLTIEEYNSIVGFCHETGIQNVASAYLEPETHLKGFLDEPFSFDKIENAEIIVVVGDIFNQAPMISKTLINWRLSNNKNRLVVIDTINTHTAAFASDFVKCRVGTEPLLLFALADEDISGIDVPTITGVSQDKISDISRNLKEIKNGTVFVSIPFAHTYDSPLLTEALKRLSEFSGKRIVPFVESVGFEGNQHFGSILSLIKGNKIKHLLNFGELFPFYYPQLGSSLKSASIYSTSPLKFSDYTALPAALNLEKEGTIQTIFGRKTLGGDIKPASGARTVDEILTLVKDTKKSDKSLNVPEQKIDVKTRMKKIVDKTGTSRKKKALLLIGEKIAYNFLGLFENEIIKLNPIDAKEMGIHPGDSVFVKSKHGKIDLAVKLTSDVDQGIASIAAEIPAVRGIFDFEINNSFVNFIPTEVDIWRKE